MSETEFDKLIGGDMTDIVNRLRSPRKTTQFDRAGRLIEYAAYPSDMDKEAADAIESARSEIERLREALDRVKIGGNHLGLVIGADHPPYTATFDEARAHYGSGDKYEVWCCWRAIMEVAREDEARSALSRARGETET